MYVLETCWYALLFIVFNSTSFALVTLYFCITIIMLYCQYSSILYMVLSYKPKTIINFSETIGIHQYFELYVVTAAKNQR